MFTRPRTLRIAGQRKRLSSDSICGSVLRGEGIEDVDALRIERGAEVLAEDVHLILDNYATHKHAKVRAWLARHPRFHLHFTPRASSWMNLVERFFADLTAEVVREGSFGSVPELVTAMETYLAERNLALKPYRWRAKGADILAKLQRARKSLDAVTSRTCGT